MADSHTGPNVRSQLELLLEPAMEDVRDSQASLRRRAWMGLGACGLIVLILMGFSLAIIAIKEDIGPGVQATLISILVGMIATRLVWVRVTKGARDELRDIYKRRVIGTLVEARMEGLSYAPDEGIEREDVDLGSLAAGPIDHYTSEDRLQGHMDGRRLTLAEVRASNEVQTTGHNGRSQTAYMPVVKGSYGLLDVEVDADARLLISPEKASTSFLEKVKGLDPEVVTPSQAGLEALNAEAAPEPEDGFMVYANAAGRALPVSGLVARMARHRDENEGGRNPRLSISNGRLHLVVPAKEDRFEPPGIWDKSIRVPEDEALALLGVVELLRDLAAELQA